MIHSQTAGKVNLFLIFFAIAALVLLRVAVRPNDYVSPDSISYLRAADLIQQKDSTNISKPTSKNTETLAQLTAIWPVGYAGCIALIGKITHTPALLASKFVNLLFLAFTFMLLSKWFGTNAWFPALYFFSYSCLEIYSFTWSEGPFIFFVLCLCFLINKHISTDETGPGVFISIFACLSCLFFFRYAGLIYFILTAGCMALFFFQKQYKKAGYYCSALVLSSIIALAYFVHNFRETGYYTGGQRIFPNKETIQYFFQSALTGLLNEGFLARKNFHAGTPDTLFILLLILQLIVIYQIWKNRKLITRPFLNSSSGILMISSITYLASVVALRMFSPFDDLDLRILAPFSIPMFLALFYAITRQQIFFRKTAVFVIAFMILSLLINLPKHFLVEQISQRF